MKSLFVLFAIMLTGCVRDSHTEEESTHQKERTDLDIENLCNNERLSIANPHNNWEVNFDSFQTIDDYFKAARDRRRFDKIDSLQNGMYSGVYPYVKKDNLIISLGPLRKISSAGYHYKNQPYHLFFRGMGQYLESGLKDEVEAYFLNYKAESPIISLSNEIQGPHIIIDFKKAPMSDFELIVASIAEAYISSLRIKSIEFYSEELCELSEIHVEELKELFPLTIEILRYDSF